MNLKELGRQRLLKIEVQHVLDVLSSDTTGIAYVIFDGDMLRAIGFKSGRIFDMSKIRMSRASWDKVWDIIKTDPYYLHVKYEEKFAQPLAPNPQPPVNAEFILHLLLPTNEQDAVIGDLLERYVRKHERFGVRRANLWFYSQIARSVWPLIKRTIGKVGLIAVGEWIRRHIS